MRERQDIVFGEGIHERERDLVVHVLAEERVGRAVAQHIVHPAHVPLEVEAQTAVIAGFRDHRPRGGLLRDHHDVRMIGQYVLVEQTQEVDRFEILASAVDVRPPFILAVVVQIQHGRDRVYAQAVHVELLDPEHRGREQQVSRRGLAIVEHARAPFLVLHLERIGVLVQMRAVELDQTAAVLREVSRNPVHDDAEAGLMRLVDQIHEILRRAVAAGRGEIADDLITPRAVERILGQRHELDVRVAHFLDVGHKLVRHLAVGIKVAVLVHLPRAEMAFVDVDRTGIRQVVLSPLEPAVVAPFVAADVIRLGGVARASLEMEAVGVGLVENVARLGPYAVLVRGIFRDIRNEFLPDALLVAGHVIGFPVPAVELTHDRHVRRLRRVYAEQISLLAVLHEGVCAHVVISSAIPARVEKLAALLYGRGCGFLPHTASLPYFLCRKQWISETFSVFSSFSAVPFSSLDISSITQ